jgi:phosphatidylglycerol:prolipoprotein diacylglycerol transferase
VDYPVFVAVGPWRVPAHLLFETLAYVVGFRLYLTRRRRLGDPLPDARRGTIVMAAALGALAGSKLLALLQHAGALVRGDDVAAVLGGKTIVGGLLGGTLAVEAAKRVVGETRRTGDLFALPMCVGLAIGRIGCHLAGLDDATHGGPTTLPWGIDFGDGVRRHPAPLYEIAFLALLGVALEWLGRSLRLRAGDVWRAFLIAYLAFRLALDALKPAPRPFLGLSAIQLACLLGLACYAAAAARPAREPRGTP